MSTPSLTHEKISVRLSPLTGGRGRLVIDYPHEAPYSDLIRAAVADLIRAEPKGNMAYPEPEQEVARANP